MTTFMSSSPSMQTSHVGADDATSCSNLIITGPEEFHLLSGSCNSLLYGKCGLPKRVLHGIELVPFIHVQHQTKFDSNLVIAY